MLAKQEIVVLYFYVWTSIYIQAIGPIMGWAIFILTHMEAPYTHPKLIQDWPIKFYRYRETPLPLEVKEMRTSGLKGGGGQFTSIQVFFFFAAQIGKWKLNHKLLEKTSRFALGFARHASHALDLNHGRILATRLPPMNSEGPKILGGVVGLQFGQ